MTILHPCHNCHRKTDCGIRAKTLASIKGLGLTKANLKCRIPEEDFPPGSVVNVSAFEIDEDDDNKTPITRRGIVRSWRERKAVVVLDKDQEIEKPYNGGNIGYLKVTSDRLATTGMPPVNLCACGLSEERCIDNDYPSTRDGKFSCYKGG